MPRVGRAAYAQVHPLAQLIDTARQGPATPGLAELITKTLSAKGGAAVWGQDYLFVTPSSSPASVSIDEQPPLPDAAGGKAPISGCGWKKCEWA